MAFSSATHDVAADGFYMMGLDQHQQAFFVGIRSTFYRLSMIVGKGVLIMLAGVLQVLFRYQIRFSWGLIFYALTGLFIAFYLYHSFVLPRRTRMSTMMRTKRQGMSSTVSLRPSSHSLRRTR